MQNTLFTLFSFRAKIKKNGTLQKNRNSIHHFLKIRILAA